MVLSNLSIIERILAFEIYVSTVLGFIFVIIARGIIPAWLYVSIGFGFVTYLLASILTVVKARVSFIIAFFLSLIVLASSLPQPEHYYFILYGQALPAFIFISGNFVQVLFIVTFFYWLYRTRGKKEREK